MDNKSAYIVGSGLAALTAACYLVRDGQMKGEHVHVLEMVVHLAAAAHHVAEVFELVAVARAAGNITLFEH